MDLKFTQGTKYISINGVTVLLPHVIWDVFECQNRALVIVDPDAGLRNAYCYSAEARLLWQIEAPAFFVGRPGTEGHTAIYLNDLYDPPRLFTVCRGRPFYLDIETGITTFIPNVPDRM